MAVVISIIISNNILNNLTIKLWVSLKFRVIFLSLIQIYFAVLIKKFVGANLYKIKMNHINNNMNQRWSLCNFFLYRLFNKFLDLGTNSFKFFINYHYTQ